MYDFTVEEKWDNSPAGKKRRQRQTDFEFIGVDGEGAGHGKDHKYILLGVGTRYIENLDGISWKEAFSFLYECYKAAPNAAFVGFFLGYDWTKILQGLPERVARILLTQEGINARARTKSGENRKPFPVRFDGWEFDMLPGRRLQIRPQVCRCIQEGKWPCQHKQLQWMYICDSGPFWQTSLLNAINPRNWVQPIVTPEEYEKIEAGKAGRSMTVEEYLQRRQEVIDYNRLENEILARAMNELRKGFLDIGLNLRKDQWYGPGQAAAAWFRKESIPRRRDIEKCVSASFWDAARKSYYGGWFEIFAHGHIPGNSFEYDINSAYPFIFSKLPCLQHGSYNSGSGRPDTNSSGRYVLVYARISGGDPKIGPMPHRDRKGRIRRPRITEGWYWLHEIEASARAGLVDSVDYKEWVSYDPCNCPAPAGGLKELYNYRLRVGKESILGKSSKLVYNSAYGKCAQSVGEAPYGNWVYASLITAGCRCMILDAIATHPDKSDAVLMVATDGIYFDRKHPNLPLSATRLGMWSSGTKSNMLLFKPGVYWDDKAREAIRNGNSVAFKARGINAKDFAHHILTIDKMFTLTGDRVPGMLEALSPESDGVYLELKWPFIIFPISFSIVSVKTALNRNKWNSAGETIEDMLVIQDSDPSDKRFLPYWDEKKGFIRTFAPYMDDDEIISCEYEKKYGEDDPFSQDRREMLGINQDGNTNEIGNAFWEILTKGRL